MDWTRHIDIYCERIDPSFWAEPINAVTNAAFFIGALVMARRLRGHSLSMAWVLVWILVLIGVGSFLFHTFAQPWAGMLDVVPILMFVVVYMFLASRDYLGLHSVVSGGIALTIAPLSAALTPIFQTLPLYGASASYMILPIMIAFYAWLTRATPSLSRGLAIGAAILMLSLTFRSLDMPLCDGLSFGTHFIWHILNAIHLAWMIEVYRRHRLAPSGAQG